MAPDASDALAGHTRFSLYQLFIYLLLIDRCSLSPFTFEFTRLCLSSLLLFSVDTAVRQKVQQFLNAARTGNLDLLKSEAE